MLDFPERKDFERDIKDSKWNIIHTMKYKQSTLSEYLSYIDMDSEKKVEYCLNIVFDWIKITLYDKFLRLFVKWFESRKKDKLMNILFWKKDEKTRIISDVIESITNTVFRSYDSIYDWITLPKSGRPSIYSSNVKSICKQYNIPWPLKLFDEYTLEQYQWMIDWNIFDNFELEDKTKVINDRALNKEWWWEITSDDIRKALWK